MGRAGSKFDSRKSSIEYPMSLYGLYTSREREEKNIEEREREIEKTKRGDRERERKKREPIERERRKREKGKIEREVREREGRIPAAAEEHGARWIEVGLEEELHRIPDVLVWVVHQVRKRDVREVPRLGFGVQALKLGHRV